MTGKAALQPWRGTNHLLGPRELGAEGCQSGAEMGSTPLGSLLREKEAARVPPAPAPVPCAGQAAWDTPTSTAQHKPPRASGQAASAAPALPALQVCPERCLWGTATSICSCWVKRSRGLRKHRKEDPSLPDLLGFTLFHSCFSSSRSLPPSSLLQGGRKSNQVTILRRSTTTHC